MYKRQVFKLSRFGRNAADVLNSLQRMQDFGVNLICVEDGIDSSKDSGKLMISVLSAVAAVSYTHLGMGGYADIDFCIFCFLCSEVIGI